MTDPDRMGRVDENGVPLRVNRPVKGYVIALIILVVVGALIWLLFTRKPVVAPATVSTLGTPTPLISPKPVPTPQAATPAQLAAAIRAAFPGGMARSGKDGDRYQFADSKVVMAPFGPVLVSEGRVADAAHVTPGQLDIAYLTRTGDGFTLAKDYPNAVVAGSFGAMSDWSVSDAFTDLPVVTAKGGSTGQGYSCAVTVLTELRGDGPAAMASIQTTYDNSGAVETGAQSYEGKITRIDKGKGFTVHFSGTNSFDDQYVLTGGKYVLQGKSRLPEC